ncbi:hypothetical protein ACT3UQ_18685 [Glutamicibacter sp. AOP12-B1-11]
MENAMAAVEAHAKSWRWLQGQPFAQMTFREPKDPARRGTHEQRIKLLRMQLER